jgi:hypothetical protein
MITHREVFLGETKFISLKLGAHWIGSAVLGTAQSAEVKLNGNKREARALHRRGAARLGTDPSARIRTFSEQWAEQNVPKVRSIRKELLQNEELTVFFSSDLICTRVSQ